nr:probable palmitoyltransferase ZDHHC4 isoform X1 [Pogona vitticeps]
MDFLVLFLLYVLLVLLSIFLVCVCSGRKQSLPSRAFTCVSRVISRIIPSQIQGVAHSLLHKFFHTRNCTFVVLHLILEALVYGEYTWEVFGYCRELEFSGFFLLLPYFLLLVNVGFFILCSKTDPAGGFMDYPPLPQTHRTITQHNQAVFVHAYPYDGMMFEKGVECATCKVRKPARSKHCGVCNCCVHRFDHHCVWVNNCIGAFNTRYFLIYLLTLTSMAASITIITGAFLIQVVILSSLMQGHYTDGEGQEHPVDAFFLIQHLFLTFPRIVFMLGFVLVLSLILASYLCFTSYLVLTNQTSNEWFKSRRGTGPYAQQGNKQNSYKNIYSRGVWRNLREIVKPLTSPAKKRRLM